MAAPLVCGVTGLMFERNPALSATEIRDILRQTAIQDGFTGEAWSVGFGAGKVDAFAALAAVPGPTVANGDIDGDGATTVLDVVLLVNHILDPLGRPLTTEQREAADVFPSGGGDGTLDISDVTRVVAFILGTAVPGRALADAPPATFAVGEPELADGAWWVPVTITGRDLAGLQFALTADGASWRPGDVLLDAPRGSVTVAAAAAGTAGEQIRVLVYATDNHLPAGGLTLRLPLAADRPPAGPRVAGLRVVDAQGFAREVGIERGGGPLHPVRFVQVTPNPARADATVAFALGRGQEVRVGVYDLKGRRLREFRLGALGAGAHTVAWDGRDGGGREVPAGLYLVRVMTPEQVETRKVVIGR
jgi:hypothetical protein